MNIRHLMSAIVCSTFALAQTGCGTIYLDEEIVRGSPWKDNSEQQFYRGIDFQKYGRAVVTFRGADGDVEVPALYTVPERGVAKGTIELTYEPTPDIAAKYREALRWWKSDPSRATGAANLSDEIPVRELYKVIARPGLTMTRSDGHVVKLVNRQGQ